MTTMEELNKEIEVAKKHGLPDFMIYDIKQAMDETKKQISILLGKKGDFFPIKKLTGKKGNEQVQRDCKRYTSNGSCKRCSSYSVAPEVESCGKEKGFCRFGMKPTEWRL